MFKKISLSVLIICSFCVVSQAQNTPVIVDSVRNELIRINQQFDSSFFVAFDVNMFYTTDTTSTGLKQTDEKTVHYEMNGSNYYYKIDQEEYIQTDSFVISIDHQEKRIIIAPNQNVRSVTTAFSLKEFMDYSINNYDSIYTFSIVDIDSTTRVIGFATSDTTVPYSKFAITYDIDTYLPIAIESLFTDPIELTEDSTASNPNPVGEKVLQTIKMSFENYTGMASGKIFDKYEYFYKDRNTKRYMPAERFKYYDFITAGLEEDEQAEPEGGLLQDNTGNQ
jgi:hypothetical protein